MARYSCVIIRDAVYGCLFGKTSSIDKHQISRGSHKNKIRMGTITGTEYKSAHRKSQQDYVRKGDIAAVFMHVNNK